MDTYWEELKVNWRKSLVMKWVLGMAVVMIGIWLMRLGVRADDGVAQMLGAGFGLVIGPAVMLRTMISLLLA